MLFIMSREERYQSISRVIDNTPHGGIVVPRAIPLNIVFLAEIVEWIEDLIW